MVLVFSLRHWMSSNGCLRWLVKMVRGLGHRHLLIGCKMYPNWICLPMKNWPPMSWSTVAMHNLKKVLRKLKVFVCLFVFVSVKKSWHNFRNVLVTGLQFLNNEGSALYSIESKSNHSCTPNAQATFPNSNHNLHLVATEDIQCGKFTSNVLVLGDKNYKHTNYLCYLGEEICISYLDDCLLSRSRHSRQKELRENYLFNCTCQKCEEQKGDPDVTSDEEDEDDENESMDEDWFVSNKITFIFLRYFL